MDLFLPTISNCEIRDPPQVWSIKTAVKLCLENNGAGPLAPLMALVTSPTETEQNGGNRSEIWVWARREWEVTSNN